MKKINVNTIISTYKSVSAIKRNQESIMQQYCIDRKSDFVKSILQPCKEKINALISTNYDGAIAAVKDAEKTLLDTLRRAKSDRRFAKECKNLDIDLSTAAYLIRTYYTTVSIDGDAASLRTEYHKDEHGNYTKDAEGHYIIIEQWYEKRVITAGNAASIIVTCLRNMKRFALKEIRPKEGWNIVKIGR
jgi:hypothetical protein